MKLTLALLLLQIPVGAALIMGFAWLLSTVPRHCFC